LFMFIFFFFFFQAEDGIRDGHVTGVQTCALPISVALSRAGRSLPGKVLMRLHLLPENPALIERDWDLALPQADGLAVLPARGVECRPCASPLEQVLHWLAR